MDCFVVVSTAGGFEGSGVGAGGGVTCFVSVLVVVVRSVDVEEGCTTVVAGGGLCWQPVNPRPSPKTASAPKYMFFDSFISLEVLSPPERFSK